MKKIITVIIIFGAVLTLAILGTWQIQRLAWKQEIITNLNAEYQKDPSQHIYDFEKLQSLKNQENPILYGSVIGHFNEQKPIFLQPKTYKGKVGAHIIKPYMLKKGGVILINLGWVAKDKIALFENLNITNKEKSVVGVFRKPDWNRFTSNNSPQQNIWTKADINQIAKHYKIDRVAPVMLYATKIENNPDLILQDAKWYPRNKHLQYAIFWYGMIFVLLVLVTIAAQQKRKRLN